MLIEPGDAIGHDRNAVAQNAARDTGEGDASSARNTHCLALRHGLVRVLML
jgi:hypothetical protein